MKRKILVVAFMLLSIVVLSSPGDTAATGDFCTTCEARCYAEAENVPDYNACVLLCNYAGCEIPIIQ